MSTSNCSICNHTHAFRCANKTFNLISSLCNSCYDKRECKEIEKIETYCNRCGKADRLFDRIIGNTLIHVCYICEWKYNKEEKGA